MKKLSVATLAIAGFFLAAVPALADTVTYTLTTVDPSVAPGGTVTFDTSIVAPSANSGAMYILSDSFSCTGCSVDDTNFNLTPFYLDPGDNYTGPLFAVTALSTDTPGVYDGTFDITFEDASGGTFTDNDPFDITVTGTPEPSTWLLLGTGLLGLGLLRRRTLTRAASGLRLLQP